MSLSGVCTFSIIIPLLMGFFSFVIKDKYVKRVNLLYLFLLFGMFFFVIYSIFKFDLLAGKQHLTVVGGWSKAMGIELKYIVNTALVLTYLLLMAIVFFATNFAGEINYRFRGFICIMLCGANGIVITNDIFNSYVFFEIICITTYIVYAYSHNIIGLKNAYNYMILSSFAGVIFLLIACFLYQISGQLNIDLMHNSFVNMITNKAISACFVLFVLVMIVKIGVYPFHGIMLGVYNNLSLKYLMIVAGISSVVYPCFIMKIVIDLFGTKILLANEYACVLLKVLGCLGFLFFNILALTSVSAVRFVISLSFSQTSFFVFCIPYLNIQQVFNGVYFNLVSNALIKVCFFGLLFHILKSSGKEDINKDEISSMLTRRDRVLFILLLFFVAGMPISMVFMSKWYILYGIINSVNSILWATLVILGFSIEIIAAFGFIKNFSLKRDREKMIAKTTISPVLFSVIAFVLFYLVVSSSFCGHFK